MFTVLVSIDSSAFILKSWIVFTPYSCASVTNLEQVVFGSTPYIHFIIVTQEKHTEGLI